MRAPLSALLLLAALSLSACGDQTTTAEDPAAAAPSEPASSSAPSSTSASPVGTTCAYPPAPPAAKEVSPPPDVAQATGKVEVTISTSQGDIAAVLDATSTPCTVNSFVSLAQQGYFDDTVCHRLTTSGIFVLQCGDPTATGTGGPGYTIPDELSGAEQYPAGTLAMAKTSAPDSGGSQFFVVYADTQLPPDYTVFGQLDAASVAVVQTVAAAGSTPEGDGKPNLDVTISSVQVG